MIEWHNNAETFNSTVTFDDKITHWRIYFLAWILNLLLILKGKYVNWILYEELNLFLSQEQI